MANYEGELGELWTVVQQLIDKVEAQDRIIKDMYEYHAKRYQSERELERLHRDQVHQCPNTTNGDQGGLPSLSDETREVV